MKGCACNFRTSDSRSASVSFQEAFPDTNLSSRVAPLNLYEENPFCLSPLLSQFRDELLYFLFRSFYHATCYILVFGYCAYFTRDLTFSCRSWKGKAFAWPTKRDPSNKGLMPLILIRATFSTWIITHCVAFMMMEFDGSRIQFIYIETKLDAMMRLGMRG